MTSILVNNASDTVINGFMIAGMIVGFVQIRRLKIEHMEVKAALIIRVFFCPRAGNDLYYDFFQILT